MNTELAYYLFLGSGLVFMVLLLHHWWGMLRNITEEKRTLATFLAPFLPFMPKMFTEKGNYHLARVGRYLIGVVIFWNFSFLFDSYRRGLILGGP